MPTKAKPEQTVSKANRFDRGVRSNNTPKASASSIVVSQEVALLVQEVSTARTRIAALETQLTSEQAGRRTDLERLLREIADLKATIARLEAEQRAAKPAE